MQLEARGIQCAVCGKPVDRTEFCYDPMRCVTVVKVWCHGATDDCAIEDQHLVDWGANLVKQMLASGVAFSEKPGAVRQLLVEAQHAA